MRLQTNSALLTDAFAITQPLVPKPSNMALVRTRHTPACLVKRPTAARRKTPR